MRTAMIDYGLRILGLSAVISVVTAVLLFLAVRRLLVIPIRRVVRHMAAYADKHKHAQLLLEAGADVEAKSTGGRTPMSLARKSRADQTAGIMSLWVLKGCKPGKPC